MTIEPLSLTAPGKRLVFTARDPARVAFEEEVAPGAPAVPVHLHRTQAETFTVLDGVLELDIAGAARRLGPGQCVIVPAGVPHTYRNGGDGVLRIAVALTPGAGAERFFAGIYALGRTGRLPPRGLGDALALAALSHRHGFYLAGLPLVLQRPLMALGAALAAMAGVRTASAGGPGEPADVRIAPADARIAPMGEKA